MDALRSAGRLIVAEQFANFSRATQLLDALAVGFDLVIKFHRSPFNTMLKNSANKTFNNIVLSGHIIAAMRTKPKMPRSTAMHPQMERLYLAASELAGVEGQSAVARLLNLSPQTVANWEDRGVSLEGMIDAQERIGCNAVWIRKGVEPMKVGDPAPDLASQGGGLADSLKLTCETAHELQLLSVYRLSGKGGRMLIDEAIDAAREALDWSNATNQGQ